MVRLKFTFFFRRSIFLKNGPSSKLKVRVRLNLDRVPTDLTKYLSMNIFQFSMTIFVVDFHICGILRQTSENADCQKYTKISYNLG